MRGEWEFTVRSGGRNNMWKEGHFYRIKPWPCAQTLCVPGCWEAQGVGKPGMSECWDFIGDHNAKPIRHKHMGNGWYRKTVKIPADWKGKRVWLKVGGVKSCGWFWVNETQVALNENYCGTYKYEITDLVTPGSNATVVVQVNNIRPSRKGLFSAMHRWGGIYRDIELEATPQTFIDDAWVRGLFDEKSAEVHVAVAYPASLSRGSSSNARSPSILNLQSSIFNIQSPSPPSARGRRNIPTSTRRGWIWWRTGRSSTRGASASACASSRCAARSST